MKTDVLIVGAGPVGMTMAAELARYGVSVRIVDKNSQRTDKSKAIVVWPRTLELLDRMGAGIADRFIQAGLKVEFANIFADGKQIGQVDLATVDTPFKFVLLIQQSETERLLEEYLAEYGVKVDRETELQDFDQSTDGVTCNLVLRGGGVENAKFSWLIGCDGAHSTVRHSLGMTFEGSTLLNDWILADVHISGIDGPPSMNIHWHSEGILALFPLGGTRYRVIADVGASASSSIGEHRDPTLEEVQKILNTRGSEELRAADPVWLSSFTINERKVADYRKGRVFLAGDAAHVHSPAGGQGMNTGMQDAFNLAWKLALVSRGLCSPEPLLMSYSAERSAVAELVLEATGRATKIALVKGELKQSLRNDVASLIFGLSPVRHMMANVLSEVAVRYSESPLNASHGFEHRRPAPGERAPFLDQGPAIGGGSSPRFALFAAAEENGYESTLSEFAGLLEPTLRPIPDSGCLWLVRPDGYVALRAESSDTGAVGAYLRGL